MSYEEEYRHKRKLEFTDSSFKSKSNKKAKVTHAIPIENLKLPFIMMVTGPKRTGKTTFIRNLFKEGILKEIDYVVVMAPTLHLNGDFDFLKEQKEMKYMMFHENFEFQVEKLFQRMEQLAEGRLAKLRELEEKKLKPTEPVKEDLRPGDVSVAVPRDTDVPHVPNTLLVLDDCATNSILSRASILDAYSIRHRHSNISMIVVGHNFKGVAGLPKAIRTQIDYNVIFNPSSISELETIIRDCLFKEDAKIAIENTKVVFNELYNYIIYTAAEVYNRRLLTNKGEMMIYPLEGVKVDEMNKQTEE